MQGDEPLSDVLAGCLHSYSRVSGETVRSFQLRKTLGNVVWWGSAREPFRQAQGVHLCPER